MAFENVESFSEVSELELEAVKTLIIHIRKILSGTN